MKKASKKITHSVILSILCLCGYLSTHSSETGSSTTYYISNSLDHYEVE